MRAFDLVSDAQMNRRRDLAQAFYEAVLDSGEHPYIASDEATTWDISTDDEAALIDRYQRHHGAELLHDHLALPLWKLLHYLEAHRSRFEGVNITPRLYPAAPSIGPPPPRAAAGRSPGASGCV